MANGVQYVDPKTVTITPPKSNFVDPSTVEISEAAPQQAAQPGFWERYKRSLGIPSLSEIGQTYQSFARHPIQTSEQVGGAALETGKTLAQAAGEVVTPWWMPKYGAPALKATVEGALNLPALKEDIQARNVPGALGTAAGDITQIVPFLLGAGESAATKAAATAKAIPEAEKASEMTRVPVTLGERLKGGKLEAMQPYLRQVPFVGRPFEKLAQSRRELLFQIRDSVTAEADRAKAAGDTIYNKIRTEDPMFEYWQKERNNIRQTWSKAKLSGNDARAFEAHQALENLDGQIRNSLEAKLGPEGVSAWEKARDYWSKYHASRDVRDTIEASIKGIDPSEQVIAAGRPQKMASTSLVENLRKIQDTPYGDLLEKAVGKDRENKILSVADLYDRVQGNGHFAYHVIRGIGYGMIGVLGVAGGLRPTYEGTIVAGLLGARAIASALVRAGGTEKVSGLLKAMDTGELSKAQAIANSIAKSEAAAIRPAIKAPPKFPDMTPEEEKVSQQQFMQELIQELEQEPGTKPYTEGLEKAISESESQSARKRTKFRSQQAIEEAKQAFKKRRTQ
jgi:hypothetical protein